MTSTASQPNTNLAPRSTAASTAPSYASAASATKKPTSTPLVVGAANPPSAVATSASSAPPTQNAKSSSASTLNGRPSTTPAAAVPSAPTFAATSNLNGGPADHSRNGSVSIPANGPNSYLGNGGAVSNKPPGLQFGYADASPAMPHCTPQPNSSAPVNIPGAGRNPSPMPSPSPIPQNITSGGKPGSTENTFKIGSFTNDGDRIGGRPNSMSQIPFHARRDSVVSQHSDMGHHGQGTNRGGFGGGRGRGGYNYNQHNSGQMGYPPGTNQFGTGRGRGGMPPQQFAPRPGAFNSPRGSPALTPVMPGQGTPNMNPVMPVPPTHGFSQQYAPPMGGFPQTSAYAQQGYPPQSYGGYGFDPNRTYSMTLPGYPNQQMHPQPMYQPASPAPGGFQNTYTTGPFTAPQGQPMSRNNSQLSERPASSTGQTSSGPIVVSGGTQPHNPQMKASSGAPTPSQVQFQKPKRSGITIKNAQGEVVNFAGLKAPTSPAPSTQQSKTPPVIASTPPPPPKTGTTASHARNESISNAANPADIKAAFLEQVKKSKEGETAKADDQTVDEAKSRDEERKKEEQRVEAETRKAAEEAKVAEEAAARVKAEAEAAAEDQKKDNAAKAEETTTAETDEERMERMIREMEEEDRRREAEQEAITARKTVEKQAAEEKAEEERLKSAAENDAKLREQEREMERLEEEKEKAREEEKKASEKADLGAETGRQSQSVSEMLASKISVLTAPQKSSPANEKAANLSIGVGSKDAALSGSAPSSAKSIGKPKPVPLNLAPLSTKSVEPPPPTAAMQALKSARFLSLQDEVKYPNGVASPNPALNAAAARKGGSYKYDSAFLLQFQKVFTEQPSVEFSQQVKALIGESDASRSAATRVPAGTASRQGSRNFFGAFQQQPVGKTLPPNSTSEQRFALSQGQVARPALQGPTSSFRGGPFPGGNQMSRQPSSNLAQPSSRSGSKRGTGGSKRTGFDAAAEIKAAKTMPLTQGLDLKPISITATGWKPKSVGRGLQSSDGGDYMDPDTVQRKVKANLNKLTPQNFDKISDQILKIAAQSKDEQDGRTLRQVIQLTFEKATDEPPWAAMYARFCNRMLETMSPEVKDVTILDKAGNVVSGGALFRKYLLNRCQEDFQRGWAVEMPKPKEGESKETILMSDDYYKSMAIKRRGLGLVEFIGELFKLGMLTERIMHECIRELLDFQGDADEAEIESLCKLLRTIGANLDSSGNTMMVMNAYFERISNLVKSPDLPSRLKFMLMDIIDLRQARWQTKDGPKGPKTLGEVRADAQAAVAQKAAEAARASTRGPPGGRSQMGRGDVRNSFPFQQQNSTQVGMDDLRRLKGSASRTASGNVTLGPTSMFNSRSSSGRRGLGPGGALTRGAEDSGASSRTGTPPTHASTNAFAALANMESENPASPPSLAASPALHHAKPAPPPAGDEKKGAE